MPPSGDDPSVFTVQHTSVTLSVSAGRVIPTYAAESSALGDDVVVVRGTAMLTPPAGAALFDSVRYTIQVAASRPVSLRLGGQALPLHWIGHQGVHVGTATWTFTQVGWTELSVPDEDLVVRVRVHSRKLDYETDYREMVRSLETQVRGLTARLVSRTEDALGTIDEPSDVWAFWVAILRAIWAILARDIRTTWDTLPPVLHSDERVLDLGQLRHPTLRDARAYAMGGNTRIVARPRVWSFLSPERLYLLRLLNHLVERIDTILHEPSLPVYAELLAIRNPASSLLRNLLSGVQLDRITGPPTLTPTPLSQSHPALRRVRHWHQELSRGLFPDASYYFAGVKDVHQLYEYWCYLTIVRLLVEESGGVLRVEPRVSRHPTDILLQAGHDAAVVQLPDGSDIRVHYEPRYNQLPTVAQRPDHVVQLEGARSVLLFDAKYRFELDAENLRAYGGGLPIPPVETINTMHQYRDAIVTVKTPHVRLVDRAVVLFPLPREHQAAWEVHRFYRSIEGVGVGAIPLTPNGLDIYLRGEIRHYLCQQTYDVPAPSVF